MSKVIPAFFGRRRHPDVDSIIDPCIQAVIDVQMALAPLNENQRGIVLEFVVKNLAANAEIARHGAPYKFEE